MNTLVIIAWFLFGMAVAIQWSAALYGIIDFSYAIRRYYPRIIRNISIWSATGAALVLCAGPRYRGAFLWGFAAYILFYILFFFVYKASTRRSMRLLDIR